LSSSSSIWSLGITAIEILTRARPYPSVPSVKEFVEQWKDLTSRVVDLHFGDGVEMDESSDGGPLAPEDDLLQILKTCFQLEPSDRSSFRKLAKDIQSLRKGGHSTDSDSLESSSSSD
jgi:Protein tyrosine and serine/threonine kinase